MLINLHVKNLALIREEEVEFQSGLNILTGETGAGKSILLGSIQLALGGKMSREMIREDADYALVELTFQVEDPRIRRELEALGVYPEDDQIWMSRRMAGKRSTNRINGETCTAAQMRAVGALLLDIHGQHEHQSLLNRKRQLDILDEYGKEKIEPIKVQTAAAYQAYQKLAKQMSGDQMDEEQRKREVSFLEFEIRELQEANLQPGEDEELEKQHRKLSNGKRILETLNQVHMCTGYDDAGGAGDRLGQALQLLGGIVDLDEDLEPMEESLTDLDGLLNDFNRELTDYLSEWEFDEEEYYQLEKRLDLINHLKSKYGNSVEEIQKYQKKQEQRLQKLQSYEEYKQELEQKLARQRKKLDEQCKILSKYRMEYAKQLERQVQTQLTDLNFLHVDFAIEFTQQGYTSGGADQVEFMISTNPGEPRKPFGKVVSGGELSRIMLAIKTLLADKDQIETLIFDEIDTGISGRTAQKVSEKMAYIGGQRQVICITHLPQIASMADAHYSIEKKQQDADTFTSIRLLDAEDSVKELARLLGGAEITERVLESAREMKDLADQQKNSRLKL
ncbi:MAG: DNA repair protein RecN [Lachnospiraceae bacterium]|nr:DNA repair protein RecN [Lachnospiraceae bacterium]